MKFEKINYGGNNIRKGIIIGFVLCALVFVIINLFLTKAKYQIVDSVPLANGTINTKGYDFKIMAMYTIDATGKEEPINTMPKSGYTINQDKSYCTLDNIAHDNNAKLYTNKNGEHIIQGLSRSDKCYLYFDKEITSKDTLDLLKLSSTGISINKFTGPSCNASADNCGTSTKTNMKQNGIYEAEDDYGTTYYFRGDVKNNWLVFGKEGNNFIWWRIVRINGNGTIRLVYAGTSSNKTQAPATTGQTTMITPRQPANSSYSRSKEFNKQSNDNTYVGYMYGQAGQSTFDATHTNAHNSTALDEIVYWYNTTSNLKTLAKYIDVDTGFCGDRQLATGNHSPFTRDGYSSVQTGYKGIDKIWLAGGTSTATEQTATFKCGYNGTKTDTKAQKRDLYTGPNATNGGIKGASGTMVEGNGKLPVPVGLLTMDELQYAGAFHRSNNNTSQGAYYLYTGSYYWSMSPSYFDGSNAYVFYVDGSGDITNTYDAHTNSYGIRPVINLKSNTKFEPNGNGTSTNPFVVVTT